MEAEIRVGASVSLTGRYALQGRQAEAGLRLWAADANREGGLRVGQARRRVHLVIHDDEGRADRLEANLAQVLDREEVDVLFGPYGSDLALRAVRLAAARGRTLWNHAGASDAITLAAPHAVVNGIAPASAYFAALPGILRSADPGFDRLAVLCSASGTFGGFVASGAAEAARAAGMRAVAVFPFAPPLADREEVLDQVRAWQPQAVICAGRFEDDVWLARRREALGAGTPLLAAVGAGLTSFGAVAGPAAEGVVGPSHWEPAPDVGRRPPGFAAGFVRANGETPEYPAALAYASGEVLAACAGRAGRLEAAALREAADALRLPTLIGGFRLDAQSGRQVGYRPLLVRWERGVKRVIWRAPAPPDPDPAK